MKSVIVSAVNLTEGGPLSVLQDCLRSGRSTLGRRWRIIALVNNQRLVDVPGVHVIQMPAAKRSWLTRLWYEWVVFRHLSRRLRADVWLSLHDISPSVVARRRIVYCHNPAPFHQLRWHELWLDWRFGLFCAFYGRLYRINIRSSDLVIVQQAWLREEFKKRFGVANVLVSRPHLPEPTERVREPHPQGRVVFFYPFFPRVFKNAEVILQAAALLARQGIHDFKVVLTITGTENRYTKWLTRSFGTPQNVDLVGRLSRSEVFEHYRQADCLIFPSRLETWGLPISEFSASGKPMLLADLPYAYESADGFDNAAFFAPSDAVQLATLMRSVIERKFAPDRFARAAYEEPFAGNWHDTWLEIVDERKVRGGDQHV